MTMRALGLSQHASVGRLHGIGPSIQVRLVDGTGDIREWHKTLKLNTLAPMALTSMFSPGMADQKVLRTLCHSQASHSGDSCV